MQCDNINNYPQWFKENKPQCLNHKERASVEQMNIAHTANIVVHCWLMINKGLLPALFFHKNKYSESDSIWVRGTRLVVTFQLLVVEFAQPGTSQKVPKKM